MGSPARRLVVVALAILVVAVTAAVWRGAVEGWIGQELRSLAATYLNPTFAFDDLRYDFPRSVVLQRVRFASPDPDAPSESVEILTVDSLALALSEIPRPGRTIRMQRIDLVRPVVHLVRARSGRSSGELVGFSNLVRRDSEHAPASEHPAKKLSERLQVRTASISGGSARYDPRDGNDAIMLIDGISATLLLEPHESGVYDVDLAFDRRPVIDLALRGRLQADDERLEIAAFSSTLQLARENDHYLAPAIQKFIAERDLTGQLKLTASGVLRLDDAAPSNLRAEIDLVDARYASGSFGLALDHVAARISTADQAATIDELTIDALGGRASITGTVALDDSLTAALRYEGADLQIGKLLRPTADSKNAPSFSGVLGFAGNVRGPLTDPDRSGGRGRLSVKQARLARLPVLSTIDEALDRTAEALMKREHTGHDALSLEFSLDGGRARIEKLRMNSRWYGLRGHGDVYFDSRLDLKVDGGPVQRLENELGIAGDVLGEITETILRAGVTGTLGDPKVQVEVLRQRLRP